MNPETLALGVQTTVVGLGVVFVVLILLMCMTAWIDKVVESLTGGPTPPAGGNRPPAQASAPQQSTASDSGSLSRQTVAAIVAAVSAFSGRSLEELRFSAIRRTGGMHTSWSQSAVAELINTRQQFI